jgi:hypothetical protein
MSRSGGRHGAPNSALVRWLVGSQFKSYIARRFLDKYMRGEGGTYVMSERDMRDIAPVIRVDLPEDKAPAGLRPLQERVAELHAQGGGSGEVDFSVQAFAQSNGTLNQFQADLKGTVTVEEDGSWSFEGGMRFRDTYDFDSHEGKESLRSPEGEMMTTWGRALEGAPFQVTSVEVAAKVSSDNPNVQWSGQGAEIQGLANPRLVRFFLLVNQGEGEAAADLATKAAEGQ